MIQLMPEHPTPHMSVCIQTKNRADANRSLHVLNGTIMVTPFVQSGGGIVIACFK